jgi:hypothetical protein
MPTQKDVIRWAPRVQPDLVQRVYEVDATGVGDPELCDDLGIRLLLRCRAILLVAHGEVECPRCEAVFAVRGSESDHAPVQCPTSGCGWQTTPGEYRKSWSKRRIFPGKAGAVFEEYAAHYPAARTYRDRILAIDKLIHGFHWDLRVNKPNRAAANNLIEGNHDQVVAFLDALSGGDPAVKESWRETAGAMMRRRKGGDES